MLTRTIAVACEDLPGISDQFREKILAETICARVKDVIHFTYSPNTNALLATLTVVLGDDAPGDN